MKIQITCTGCDCVPTCLSQGIRLHLKFPVIVNIEEKRRLFETSSIIQICVILNNVKCMLR